MKTLSKEEAAKLVIASGRETVIGNRLRSLEPGEALIIDKQDWPGKGSPYRIANYLSKTKGLLFEKGRLQTNKGWVIKRVK